MTEPMLARRSVAVVEDNADNRLLVGAILEGTYNVVPYASGQDAILGCHDAPPDLILLDISLPGMDGTQVLRVLRADPALAAVRVVALTADAMSGAREMYLGLGFDDYIAKPILHAQDLRDAVDRLLRTD
jgi:CheY-like chemotaxis protein